LPGQSSMEVLDHIKKVLKPLNVKINPLKMNEPSAISSIDTAGYRTLSRSLEIIIPGIVPVPYLVLGGTDASRYESICTAVYRFSPYILDPELLQTIHGEDERISFENIDRCIGFYSDVIKCPMSV
ncbi:MAG: M20/M25/M40 family metallo-hydrolase, partial [Clostridia bacterium]